MTETKLCPSERKNTNEKENDTHERANDGHLPKNGQLLPTWYPILSGCSEADHIMVKMVNFGSHSSILKVKLHFLLYM